MNPKGLVDAAMQWHRPSTSDECNDWIENLPACEQATAKRMLALAAANRERQVRAELAGPRTLAGTPAIMPPPGPGTVVTESGQRRLAQKRALQEEKTEELEGIQRFKEASGTESKLREIVSLKCWKDVDIPTLNATYNSKSVSFYYRYVPIWMCFNKHHGENFINFWSCVKGKAGAKFSLDKFKSLACSGKSDSCGCPPV